MKAEAGCRWTRHVDRHFAGQLPFDEERALRAHLPVCAVCHRRYRRKLLWANYDPAGLSAEERIARGLGLSRAPALGRRLSLLTLAPVLAAAAALVWLVVRPTVTPPEFQARGAASAPAPEFWAYRIAAGETTPLGDSLGAEDELAFVYFVPDRAENAKFLLVFGVDEHRHVYWYHPAWVEADSVPSSIPVMLGRHELGEAIAHRFDGHELTLYAVFTAVPVSVKEVEDVMIKGDPVFTGRALWSRKVRVNR